METDLVTRLRATEKRTSYLATNATAPVIKSEYDAPINPDGPEAADHITTLEAEIEGLREALMRIKHCARHKNIVPLDEVHAIADSALKGTLV